MSDTIRIDSAAILAAVRENIARLDSCAGPHDFSEVVARAGRLGTRYRCTACRGEADRLQVLWYQQGLAHARKG